MSMLSVQVLESGQAPQPVQVPIPAPPAPSSGEVQLRVLAAGLHNVVRSRAAGRHYTSSLPHTLGVDGVGRDPVSGKTYYFTALNGQGSFAEVVNVKRDDVTEVPGGEDVVQVAALMNPVMSGWMALRTRVDFLKDGKGAEKGWDCMIMGVTSMSGRLAIKVARAMGVSKVFGAARNEEAMKSLDLDAYIVLKEDPAQTDFSPAVSASVVLDYLYGPWMMAYLANTITATHPLTYICIGSLAGTWANLPSAALRRRDVTLRGSGIGAWREGDVRREIEGMVTVLRGVSMGEVKSFKMGDVEAGMGKEGRVVFVTEAYEALKG